MPGHGGLALSDRRGKGRLSGNVEGFEAGVPRPGALFLPRAASVVAARWGALKLPGKVVRKSLPTVLPLVQFGSNFSLSKQIFHSQQ